MGVDHAVHATTTAAGTASRDGVAGGGERLVLCPVVRLPVADAAAGFPAALDGAGLVLPLAGRRHVDADQPPSADGGARSGRAGSEPVRRVIDSQSVKT